MRIRYAALIAVGSIAFISSAHAQQRCRGLIGVDGACTLDAAVDRAGRISNIVATSHVSVVGSPIGIIAPNSAFQRITRGITIHTAQPAAAPAPGGGPAAPTPIRVCNGQMTCFRLR